MSESKEDTNNSDTVNEIWHSWSEKCRTELLQTSTSFHDIEQNLSSNLKKNWELAFYYKCKQCDGPTYASLEDLKFAHKACFENGVKVKSRADIKYNVICIICDKKYSCRKSAKLHHRRIHLKEKKHVCTKCLKSFFAKKDLSNHEKRHVKESPILKFCTKCPKSYFTKQALLRHEKQHEKLEMAINNLKK